VNSVCGLNIVLEYGCRQLLAGYNSFSVLNGYTSRPPLKRGGKGRQLEGDEKKKNAK
jgi:hypothetical protein